MQRVRAIVEALHEPKSVRTRFLVGTQADTDPGLARAKGFGPVFDRKRLRGGRATCTLLGADYPSAELLSIAGERMERCGSFSCRRLPQEQRPPARGLFLL